MDDQRKLVRKGTIYFLMRTQ
uniref:Uncharacterized protein n=1 Tax=Rhizophora mucronata TaxID=61149 RepID=A0A2P2P9J9_RHIMU